MLDDQHGRRDVVVGDRAGGALAGGQVAGAAGRARLGVAGVRTLVERVVGVGVERDRRALLITGERGR